MSKLATSLGGGWTVAAALAAAEAADQIERAL
jgi:hypothetical protein